MCVVDQVKINKSTCHYRNIDARFLSLTVTFTCDFDTSVVCLGVEGGTVDGL